MTRQSSTCLLAFVLVSLSLLAPALAGNAEEWKARSIYQVLTDRFARSDNSKDHCANLRDYCGGTFTGIKNKLDYIASMGFDAIWISPVVSNIEGAYHGYYATDFYGINHHFGTAQDLKDLINTAHSKGIWVMVDVVANHVAPVGMDFSKISPFNSPDHYHAVCQINDWFNQWEVENCRFADLPDLDQSNPWVREELKKWIKFLITEYKFDGVRIDTIPQVHPDFWAEFSEAAGVYNIGECSNSNHAYVGNYQNYLDALLNYPLFYQIKQQFGERQSMMKFRDHNNEMAQTFRNEDLLGVFVDNHDMARFLGLYRDERTLKAALTFVLSIRGIPITYYGSEHAFVGGNDPEDREVLWPAGYEPTAIGDMLKLVNHARKNTQWYNKAQTERYIDDSVYAFTRGDVFFAFTNQPDHQQIRSITYHPYSEGETLCNVFFPVKDCVKIENGAFPLMLNNGEAKIFVRKSQMAGYPEAKFNIWNY